MSDAANAQAFADPRWRLIAGGFRTELGVSNDQGIGTGGIVNAQPTRLPTGQYYYRFASSHKPRPAQLGGGWWVDFENFNLIRRFAQANDYALHEAARLMLALPYDWTRVDLLVRALLAHPLRAYTGYGKPAQGAAAGPDRGTRWIPTQHVRVRQLYIPGLGTGGPPPLFETVFASPVEVTRLEAGRPQA